MGRDWALEIEAILGPVKWHRAVRRAPFGAQKSQDGFAHIKRINHRSINSYYIGRGGREVVGGERCRTEIVATDLVWLTFLYIPLLSTVYIAGAAGRGE